MKPPEFRRQASYVLDQNINTLLNVAGIAYNGFGWYVDKCQEEPKQRFSPELADRINLRSKDWLIEHASTAFWLNQVLLIKTNWAIEEDLGMEWLEE